MESVPPINFKSHFKALSDFLRPYTWVFNREIIMSYPDCLEQYPDKWADQLKTLTLQQQWQFDAQIDFRALKGTELGHLREAIQHLCQYKNFEAPDDLNLPSWAFFKTGGKKRHEIAKLGKLLQSLFEKHQLERLIDIGGGVGHLSRVLAYYFQVPMLSIDANKEFQKTGQKRLIRHPIPQDAQPVEFYPFHFNQEKALKLGLFHQGVGSIGLHTCGPLAIEHLKTFHSSTSKFALNFGCCYNRLSTQDLWQSQIAARLAPFQLSSFALTLATRGQTRFSLKEYQFKKRVKFFRYMLHLFLREHYGEQKFVPVGSSHPRLYQGSFEAYALEKLKNVPDSKRPKANQLKSYFNDPQRQEEVHKMFLWNLVRWQLGRPLEFLIILDRCLWLEERGHRVSLYQFFREEISPRNLGILTERQ